MIIEETTPAEAQYLRSLERSRRRHGGVFFTPLSIVSLVVEESLARPLAVASWREDGSPRLRILDPAAGSGRFLLVCLEHLVAAAGRLGYEASTARSGIVRRCLVGVERDPQAAAVARIALGEGADVRVGEALLGDLVEKGAWDVVVGNPPYVRSVRLKKDDPDLWRQLKGAFAATSHGEWDLYGAFIERSLDWVAPGGEIGLVVPSRWLTAAFAGPLRARLAAARVIRKIVDFGPLQVFPGATTYSMLVFLAKRCVTAVGSPAGCHSKITVVGSRVAVGASAEVVEVQRLVSSHAARPASHSSSARTQSCRLAAAGFRLDGYDWCEGTVPLGSLSSRPFLLEVGSRARLLEVMRAAGPPLADLARIAKGAGSNADSVFLLDREVETEIEDEALVPCLRGRDVEPYRTTVRCRALLPYHDGRLLAPAEIAARWPRAFSYLERCRPVLERRESGRFAGPGFYCWGRPQNLRFLLDRAPKIVVPDATREGRAALDRSGLLVMDTAYAIRPVKPQRAALPGLLLAVLNSPAVGLWLASTGILLRGGYLRMKTGYLASLPIPDPTSRQASRLARAALALAL
ncbi:MAG: N-6 DNA methylase, partial [Pseudomonadota bacterium]